MVAEQGLLLIHTHRWVFLHGFWVICCRLPVHWKDSKASWRKGLKLLLGLNKHQECCRTDTFCEAHALCLNCWRLHHEIQY